MGIHTKIDASIDASMNVFKYNKSQKEIKESHQIIKLTFGIEFKQRRLNSRTS